MRQDSRGPRRDFNRGFAPVKVGDELDVKIEAVGEKGDGIAKKDGFVLFVPGTKQGDQVRIKVTRVLQKVGFAEVIGQPTGEQQSESGSGEQQEEGSYESSDTNDSDNGYSGQDTEDFGEDDSG